MRLHEFTDPSKYFPSKIEAASPADYAKRNPPHDIEDDAGVHPCKLEKTLFATELIGDSCRIDHVIAMGRTRTRPPNWR